MVCIAWDVGAPEKVAYQVVLADVVGKVVDAAWSLEILWENRVAGGVGDLVQVSLAEHVALADNAWGYSDDVDGAVELDVRGGHEHFVEAATAVVGYSLQ